MERECKKKLHMLVASFYYSPNFALIVEQSVIQLNASTIMLFNQLYHWTFNYTTTPTNHSLYNWHN